MSSDSDLEIRRKRKRQGDDGDTYFQYLRDQDSSSDEDVSRKEEQRYLLSANQLKRKYKHLWKPCWCHVTKMKMGLMEKWLKHKQYNWRSLFPSNYSEMRAKPNKRIIRESNLFNDVISYGGERSKKSRDYDKHSKPNKKVIQVMSSSFTGPKKRKTDEGGPKYVAKPKFARYMSKPEYDVEAERREERVASAVSAALHQWVKSR